MSNFQTRLFAHPLQFLTEAGTSRGVLTSKTSYFLEIKDADGRTGIGEAGPLRGLSPEFLEDCLPQFELSLQTQIPFQQPSLRMAMEMALLDYENQQDGVYFDNAFSRGKTSIPINGLIWMGTAAHMRAQIAEKLAAGYTCLKLKIGAIDFQQELDLIHEIRAEFSKDDLSIRVDANGAFSAAEAPFKLEKLAKYNLHSIEQPIQVGQWKAMRQLCAESIIQIALDEELIGNENPAEVLDAILPPYIILKPSLVGGFEASRQWIQAAEKRNIAWWITSALESNVGLAAIAQFAASFDNPLPHGLGTGQLYTNNYESGLHIKKGHIFNDPRVKRSHPFR